MKISVRKLNKSFKDAAGRLTILSDLDADFEGAGSVAIVGKSGIGKSTFLQIIGGLDKPTSGSVKYEDLDIVSLETDELARFRGANVGFIFQFHNLLPEFTALENTAMPLIIAGRPAGECFQAAEQILDKVGLSGRLSHRPSELSGGEQQRVAIARAIVHKPKVILADEPTGNLDYKTSAEVQSLLSGISSEMGSTLIIVTHNTELARSMQRVYEMQPGGALTPA